MVRKVQLSSSHKERRSRDLSPRSGACTAAQPRPFAAQRRLYSGAAATFRRAAAPVGRRSRDLSPRSGACRAAQPRSFAAQRRLIPESRAAAPVERRSRDLSPRSGACRAAQPRPQAGNAGASSLQIHSGYLP